ncbi:MAG: hypothetical protein KGY46_09150, partial [Anaerolineales bacterium]|nr:hypothetical protein [Anaerolineales bacterium]
NESERHKVADRHLQVELDVEVLLGGLPVDSLWLVMLACPSRMLICSTTAILKNWLPGRR